MKTLVGIATAAIEFGDPVLCRNHQCSPAHPTVANGKAKVKPKWTGQVHYKKGDFVTAEPIEGVGERVLQAIADGPIMEPSRIYLPAGKLSKAEYQERLALQFSEAGIVAGDKE